MNGLIKCLAISIGLVALCALMVGAGEHHGNKTRAVWCQEICTKKLPIEQKACFMGLKTKKVHHVSLECAGCRRMRFCNFGKCTDSSCKQDRGTTTTKKPDDYEKEHKKDPICKEEPCKGDVKYICAKVIDKKSKKLVKLDTFNNKKCMEYWNKCVPEQTDDHLEFCHEGECGLEEEGIDRCD